MAKVAEKWLGGFKLANGGVGDGQVKPSYYDQSESSSGRETVLR